MVSLADTCFRSRIRVHYKDKDGVLHSLQQLKLSQRIIDAISRGKRRLHTRSLSGGDLNRLAQLVPGADGELDLVVEFLWDPKCFMAIVAKTDNPKLRRQVLEMALNRIRRKPMLRKILAAKGLLSCKIRENPHLEPGHPPYENFIQTLSSATDGGNPEREKLFELLLESAADDADVAAFTSVEQRGVRVVFHGTNHDVMDDILESGLQPSFRNSDLREDYFGVDHSTSVPYTMDQTYAYPEDTDLECKLLVFMIIVDLEVYPKYVTSGKVTVKFNRFQLPLAEITLRNISEE